MRWTPDCSCARWTRELVRECSVTLSLAAPRHPLDAHRLVARASPTHHRQHHMALSSMLILSACVLKNARVVGSYTASTTSDERQQIRTAHTSALSPARTLLFLPT